MKICQLCAVDFTMEKFLLPLIDGLQEEGDEVVGVCSDGEFVPGMRARGYRIDTMPISRSMHPLKHLRSIWVLIKYFRHEKFDVVHVHTPVAALVGRIAAWIARVQLIVYTAHGFYFHDEMPALKRRTHIGLEWFAGRLTDLLFTQSEEDAHTAAATGIMPPERVFAIGNGVDVARFDPGRVDARSTVRKELGIPDNGFVVCMIGRLVKEKGVVEFLDSARSLTERHPRVYFVLIGERLVSDHASAVDRWLETAQKSMGSKLIVPGMDKEIHRVLSAVDLFTLPSWREGMPRTIIEAMMMGLPVIATDIRGSREEVVSEVTGLLVPLRDSAALTYAIEQIILNPEWGRTLGSAGRKRALKLYDERKVVVKQDKLIHRFARLRDCP